MLRSLIVFCLACVLCGCNPTSLPEKTPPKTTAPTNSPSRLSWIYGDKFG